MITEKELYSEINRLENCDDPHFSECQKLAVLYTIKNELYGENVPETRSEQIIETVVGDYGDSDFYKTVAGKNSEFVFDVFDELMSTLKIIQPRLYAGVLRKLKK